MPVGVVVGERATTTINGEERDGGAVTARETELEVGEMNSSVET